MGLTVENDKKGLSANQLNVLQKFRSKLHDILTTDHTDAELLRWLIGNNFDLKKSERIFREVDSCRKVMGQNTITDTYILPEAFRKYGRTAFLGFAKDGSAIRYYCVHTDILGLIHCYSLLDTFQFFVYIMECDLKKLRERNKKTGQNDTKITFIIDFEDFTYSEIFHSLVINVGLEAFSKYQEYYPETWSRFLMINAPYIIDKIMLLFKPAFNNRFLESFHFAMKSSTSTLLRKYIDDDVLPAFLGGSRVDSSGDPRCREIILSYRKVPEEYYKKNSMHFLDETDPGVKVAVLRPWSVYSIPVIIKETGTKIRMESRTDGGGLHFSILHKKFSSDSEIIELPESNEKFDLEDESSNVRQIVPRAKGYTHVSPDDFTIHAYWSGIYIFYFENASNWFASRKVYYRITVFPQDS